MIIRNLGLLLSGSEVGRVRTVAFEGMLSIYCSYISCTMGSGLAISENSKCFTSEAFISLVLLSCVS
jgi:hypothetical protein